MSEKTAPGQRTKGGPESEERQLTAPGATGDTRHLACFLAHLETATGVPRSALIRDLSVSGALLLTRGQDGLIGDTVKFSSLYLREGSSPFATTRATVVRCEEQRSGLGEMVHPWTKAVAVQFDEPIPGARGVEASVPRRPPGGLRRAPRAPSPTSPRRGTGGQPMPRLVGPLLLAAALGAPLQCARKPSLEHRTEDDAAEVLYTLAD